MRYLVVGSGAREHALAWKLAQEGEVIIAQGNPGMAACGTVYPEVLAKDVEGVVSLALEVNPDLVVVGPEDPLILGLADSLRASTFNVFGPDAAAAKLEGSKAFSKALMAEAGVPTAQFQVFEEAGAAKEYVKERFAQGRQVAVKASGAALGKGVVVCATEAEAFEAVDMMLVEGGLGEAGRTVVIEDRLTGREFSLLTLVSGQNILSLPVAQDYKRALDGDKGGNTGGMGAYSPVSRVSDSDVQKTEESVVKPILAALASRGIEYRGCLFSGMMGDGSDMLCLEYNVRFGDPECQTIMRRLGPGFGEALNACAHGQEIPPIPVLADGVVTLSLASAGYPGPVTKGETIEIGQLPAGVEVFHAGTSARPDGTLVTAGGRVLSLTASAPTVAEARSLAYEALPRVRFKGCHVRTDIAAEAS